MKNSWSPNHFSILNWNLRHFGDISYCQVRLDYSQFFFLNLQIQEFFCYSWVFSRHFIEITWISISNEKVQEYFCLYQVIFDNVRFHKNEENFSLNLKEWSRYLSMTDIFFTNQNFWQLKVKKSKVKKKYKLKKINILPNQDKNTHWNVRRLKSNYPPKRAKIQPAKYP